MNKSSDNTRLREGYIRKGGINAFPSQVKERPAPPASMRPAITDDGSEPTGDRHWDEKSFCHCPDCEFEGRLGEFLISAAETSSPPNDSPSREEELAAMILSLIKAYMVGPITWPSWKPVIEAQKLLVRLYGACTNLVRTTTTSVADSNKDHNDLVDVTRTEGRAI
jgi:hypothetical protein